MSENEEGKKPEEEKTFTADYVKQLREEAKENRLKYSETEKRLQELQMQIEEEKKLKDTEQGKFKELYEKESETKKQLQTEFEEIKTFKEKYEKLETEIRDDLLKQLEDSHKEIAKDLDIIKLKSYVALNSAKHNYDTSRTGGMSFVTDGKNWTDYTSKELDEISQKNKSLFNKLYENFLKTKK